LSGAVDTQARTRDGGATRSTPRGMPSFSENSYGCRWNRSARSSRSLIPSSARERAPRWMTREPHLALRARLRLLQHPHGPSGPIRSGHV
jgi:hypothetical protein